MALCRRVSRAKGEHILNYKYPQKTLVLKCIKFVHTFQTQYSFFICRKISPESETLYIQILRKDCATSQGLIYDLPLPTPSLISNNRRRSRPAVTKLNPVCAAICATVAYMRRRMWPSVFRFSKTSVGGARGLLGDDAGPEGPGTGLRTARMRTAGLILVPGYQGDTLLYSSMGVVVITSQSPSQPWWSYW